MNRWREQLERELRESPVPDHGPDHFARVRERLAECRETAAAERSRELPRPADGRARRRPARLGMVAALAAALVAAPAITGTVLNGLERAEPAQATAGTVLQRVQAAMAGLASIGGDIVEYGEARGRRFSRKVGAFVFTSAGDCRLEHTSKGLVCTYDAASGVAWRVRRQGGAIVASERATGLPDAGPFLSPWLGVPQVLDRSVAAYARAVIAELDPGVPVRPVTYEGRTAWRIDVAQRLVGGGVNGSVGIVVDSASGYPLLVEHWTEDGAVSGTRVRHLRVDAATTGDLFTADADAASRYVQLSERHRRLTLPEAAALGERLARAGRADAPRGKASAATRFSPCMPQWIPEGYRLDGVTGAVNGAVMGRYMEARRDGETGSLTVVLTYRRGFDRFCVISAWRRTEPRGSGDPFSRTTAASPFVRSTVIEQGALRGSEAHVVIGPSDWPHLYATAGSDRHVSVSVAGDLTRGELLRVASSLRPIETR